MLGGEGGRPIRQLQPSGFDPVPLLKQMTVPGIWVYGRQDRSQPAEKSAATLERLRTTEVKDFTVVLFPQAGHGLLDNPGIGSARDADPAGVDPETRANHLTTT